MPKIAKELSSLEVKRLRHSGEGAGETVAVGGVSGLLMQLLPLGGKSWLLLVMVGGKRREIGIGGYPDVTLAQARERARAAKEMIRQGIDPAEDRKLMWSQLVAALNRGLTFTDAVDRYLGAKLATVFT